MLLVVSICFFRFWNSSDLKDQQAAQSLVPADCFHNCVLIPARCQTEAALAPMSKVGVVVVVPIHLIIQEDHHQ